MLNVSTNLRIWLFLAAVGTAAVASPRETHALGIVPEDFGPWTSKQAFNQCRQEGESVWTCIGVRYLVDPVVKEVTGLSMAVEYDRDRYLFNRALSGPLGLFALGGDSPPVVPGVGTQPLSILPPSGFAPGAPLPGSMLTITDLGGVVTLNYKLASPVTVDAPVNFFIFGFDLIEPVVIDLSRSTVTYLTNDPGADFSEVSFACTTIDLLGGCGNEHPARGVTVNYGVVPEPSTLLLLGSTLAGLGGFAWRRQRRK